MRQHVDSRQPLSGVATDGSRPRDQTPRTECPVWCLSEHAPGDLEDGDFVCTFPTLTTDDLAGFEVGVQVSATLVAGEVVFGQPEVYVVGFRPLGMTSDRASLIGEAIQRASRMAKQTRMPTRLRLVAGERSVDE